MVWPQNHDDVVTIVTAAAAHDVCVIPFGGGTTVSGAVSCPVEEQRMIVSLDTTDMNKILWVDKENLLAHCEAGIVGQVKRIHVKEVLISTTEEEKYRRFFER